MKDRDAWLAERRRGIGGSDQASVWNEPPFGCSRALWMEKRAVEPDYPAEYSAVMRRGHALEAPAAELYAEATGRVLAPATTLVSTEHPWARVNLDRVIEPVPENDGPGVLEIKTMGLWPFNRARRDGLTTGYILQLQHALLVSGFTWGAFAVVHPDSWSILAFDVARDDALIEQIVDAGARFWRTVEHGPMPPPLPEIDRACRACPWRRQCRGEELLTAARLSADERTEHLEVAADLDDLLVDYREAARLADDAAATVDAIKDAIRERLGARQAVQTPAGWRVYYRTQISQRVDSRALKSKYPDVYADVLQPSESRPLRLYES